MKIGFAGDYALHGYISNEIEPCLTIDAKITEFLKSNDYNVVDLEGPCTLSPIVKKNGLCQNNSDKCAEFLRNNCFNICFLANNHMSDCGFQGITDTIEFCKENSILYLGAGYEFDEAIQPVVIETEKERVGIIGIGHEDGIIASPMQCSGGILCDKHRTEIYEAIQSLKETVDYCVVIYHGGEEFYKSPCDNDREKYLAFLKHGADVVIAHHPHVVRGYEAIGKKYIFYSLGNFLFDTPYQRRNRDTENGMILRLNFSKITGINFEVCFTQLDREKRFLSIVNSNDSFSLIDSSKIQSRYEHDVYESVIYERKTKKFGFLKQCVKTIVNSSDRKKYSIALRYAIKRKSNEN